MTTLELSAFIKDQRERNVSDDLIKTNLINNGWSLSDIEQALNRNVSDNFQPPPSQVKSKSKFITCLVILILFILVIPLIIITLLVTKGLFIIPLFILPKTTQQMMSGQNCDNLPKLFQRNMCYKSKAFDSKNDLLCEKMIISAEDETSSQNRGLCYKDIARITHNPVLCENAGQFKDECLSEAK